jgi:hypothetical protein
MSIERTVPASPAEPNPPAATGGEGTAGGDGTVSSSLRLQILATEHWSLLATRSLAWNEVFSRVGMHLTALSGSIVALALVGQGTGFGDTFVLFGIVILPVVLFVGVATFLRLGSSNYTDALSVMGMNRIRAGYLELAPDLERFFVTGVHDDPAGVARTMGLEPGLSPLVHLLGGAPTVVAVVNACVGAAFAGFALVLLRAPEPIVVAGSILAFAATLVPHMRYARNRVQRLRLSTPSAFPGPGAS